MSELASDAGWRCLARLPVAVDATKRIVGSLTASLGWLAVCNAGSDLIGVASVPEPRSGAKPVMEAVQLPELPGGKAGQGKSALRTIQRVLFEGRVQSGASASSSSPAFLIVQCRLSHRRGGDEGTGSQPQGADHAPILSAVYVYGVSLLDQAPFGIAGRGSAAGGTSQRVVVSPVCEFSRAHSLVTVAAATHSASSAQTSPVSPASLVLALAGEHCVEVVELARGGGGGAGGWTVVPRALLRSLAGPAIAGGDASLGPFPIEQRLRCLTSVTSAALTLPGPVGGGAQLLLGHLRQLDAYALAWGGAEAVGQAAGAAAAPRSLLLDDLGYVSLTPASRIVDLNSSGGGSASSAEGYYIGTRSPIALPAAATGGVSGVSSSSLPSAAAAAIGSAAQAPRAGVAVAGSAKRAARLDAAAAVAPSLLNLVVAHARTAQAEQAALDAFTERLTAAVAGTATGAGGGAGAGGGRTSANLWSLLPWQTPQMLEALTGVAAATSTTAASSTSPLDAGFDVRVASATVVEAAVVTSTRAGAVGDSEPVFKFADELSTDRIRGSGILSALCSVGSAGLAGIAASMAGAGGGGGAGARGTAARVALVEAVGEGEGAGVEALNSQARPSADAASSLVDDAIGEDIEAGEGEGEGEADFADAIRALAAQAGSAADEAEEEDDFADELALATAPKSAKSQQQEPSTKPSAQQSSFGSTRETGTIFRATKPNSTAAPSDLDGGAATAGDSASAAAAGAGKGKAALGKGPVVVSLDDLLSGDVDFSDGDQKDGEGVPSAAAAPAEAADSADALRASAATAVASTADVPALCDLIVVSCAGIRVQPLPLADSAPAGIARAVAPGIPVVATLCGGHGLVALVPVITSSHGAAAATSEASAGGQPVFAAARAGPGQTAIEFRLLQGIAWGSGTVKLLAQPGANDSTSVSYTQGSLCALSLAPVAVDSAVRVVALVMAPASAISDDVVDTAVFPAVYSRVISLAPTAVAASAATAAASISGPSQVAPEPQPLSAVAPLPEPLAAAAVAEAAAIAAPTAVAPAPAPAPVPAPAPAPAPAPLTEAESPRAWAGVGLYNPLFHGTPRGPSAVAGSSGSSSSSARSGKRASAAGTSAAAATPDSLLPIPTAGAFGLPEASPITLSPQRPYVSHSRQQHLFSHSGAQEKGVAGRASVALAGVPEQDFEVLPSGRIVSTPQRRAVVREAACAGLLASVPITAEPFGTPSAPLLQRFSPSPYHPAIASHTAARRRAGDAAAGFTHWGSSAVAAAAEEVMRESAAFLASPTSPTAPRYAAAQAAPRPVGPSPWVAAAPPVLPPSMTYFSPRWPLFPDSLPASTASSAAAAPAFTSRAAVAAAPLPPPSSPAAVRLALQQDEDLRQAQAHAARRGAIEHAALMADADEAVAALRRTRRLLDESRSAMVAQVLASLQTAQL